MIGTLTVSCEDSQGPLRLSGPVGLSQFGPARSRRTGAQSRLRSSRCVHSYQARPTDNGADQATRNQVKRLADACSTSQTKATKVADKLKS
jgi:hypothetical protein